MSEKKINQGRSLFSSHQVEILKAQHSTSFKLPSPLTETISWAARLYEQPNSLKSLFSPNGMIF